MSDLGFWIFFTVAVVLFAGEPDLHSQLIDRLACPAATQGQP